MISSHKMLKIKWFLTTKQKQNHPILEWIPMKLALCSPKTTDYIHNLIWKTKSFLPPGVLRPSSVFSS
uniref:Uncharacterized protein n=1 Tax=Naja naja TaxID=35670 RepID=A0A8C6Y5B9_NAJNA